MSTPSEPDLSAFASLAHELALTMAHVVGDLALVVDAQGVVMAVAEGASVPVEGSTTWVGRAWADTVCEGSRAKLTALLDEVDRSGQVVHGRELMHPGPQGDTVPIAWSAIRLGPLGPVLAVGRDLRAMTAMQQRFVEVQQEMERHYWRYRQVQSRYQQLHQVAHDAVLMLDAASLVVLQANDGVATVLGRDLSHLLHQPLTDNLPDRLRGDVLELLVAARSGGRALSRRALVGESAASLDMTVAPLAVEGRRHLMLRARDARLSAEDEALALSRMASFVESTPQGLVITDADGKVRMAGATFLAWVGQEDDNAMRHRTLADWVNDPGGAWSALTAQVRRVGMVSGQRLDVQSASGDLQPVEVSAALLAETEPSGVGWVLRMRREEGRKRVRAKGKRRA